MKGSKLFKIIILFTGVLLMAGLFGCGKQKYKLILPSGFESKKTSYAAGEEVKVTFSFFATDTDYSFFCDTDCKQSFSSEEGYVFTFTMPERDVYFWVESRNSMVYHPEVKYTEKDLKDRIHDSRMVFDCYSATTGTDGYDGYDEYALYRWEESDLLLVSYSKWEEEGKGEVVRVCRVPLSLLYDAVRIAHEYGMQNWKDGMAITGAFYAVRFYEGGELIRVSSDDMPEDGQKAFGSIESFFKRAWGNYGPKGETDPDYLGIIDDPRPEEVSE